MRRDELGRIPLSRDSLLGLATVMHWLLFGLFLALAAVVGARLAGWEGVFGDAQWPEGALVVLAAGTTIASASRRLPLQNVIAASGLITVISGAMFSLGSATGIPYGRFSWTAQMGQRLVGPLPWVVPVLWIVWIFAARGVAQLVLRPWRPHRYYGFWVLGLTTLLVVLLDLGLEPMATRLKHYWLWQTAKTSLSWFDTPWVNFFGWGITALAVLAFVTPVLIDKRPGNRPPDFHPLAVWLVLNGLMLVGVSVHRLWAATVLIVVSNCLVAFLAIRGGATRKTTEP